MNIAYNMDCMDYMRTLPDKAFDLAVVDPPYGGGGSQFVQVERERELHGGAADFEHRKRSRFGGRLDRYFDQGVSDGREMGEEVQTGGGFSPDQIAPDCHNARGRFSKYSDTDIRHWDFAPPPEYFTELARVSKNQIIWGGNYFDLPPTRCFLVWKKLTISENFTMAMAEYAWTSFNDNAKVFECAPQDPTGKRFHPTQKPVALYRWIFQRYAKPGDKILDTHLGSGSSRIAAYDAGLDFVGIEINKDYFNKQEERFAEHTAQLNLFLEGEQQ